MASQTSWSKFDNQVDTTNKRLDRVRIRRRGKSLYLRATLPPKAGEPKAKQRDLPTGKSANRAGLGKLSLLPLSLNPNCLDNPSVGINGIRAIEIMLLIYPSQPTTGDRSSGSRRQDRFRNQPIVMITPSHSQSCPVISSSVEPCCNP